MSFSSTALLTFSHLQVYNNRPTKMMSDLNMFHGKNVWLCFISIIFVHFCHKTEKYLFSNSLKYFNFFYQRKWLQIWVCPIKHCLIWFKRRCLRLILAISWEVRILNFLDVVYYFSSKESVVRSKCVSFSFFFFFVLFFVFCFLLVFLPLL